MVKKRDKQVARKVQKANRGKHKAFASTRALSTLGLPTDPWWEEAFKLGVERVAATAALNSLDDAKREGIVGPKTYERLRQVYIEKLSSIEDKTTKWHREFPTFSEPASRSRMMSELSQAVGQPGIAERAQSRPPIEPEPIANPSPMSRASPPTLPSAGRREPSLSAGPSNIRRAMIDELKGVLSSANSSLTKVVAPPVGRRASAAPREQVKPAVPKLPEVPPPKVQNIKLQPSNKSKVPSRFAELNREFLEEFKKLRKTGSE